MLGLFSNNSATTLYSQTRLQQAPQIAVKASDYSVLERPSLFHQRILELIGSAQERIMMTMLYLQDDEAGQEVMQALYEARARNPQLYIRIYVDFHRAQRGRIGENGGRTNAQMYAQWAQGREDAPAIYGVPVKRRELFGVMHLKGCVFDNTVLYSGASVNNVYLGVGGRYRLDRYHEIHSTRCAATPTRYSTKTTRYKISRRGKSRAPRKSRTRSRHCSAVSRTAPMSIRAYASCMMMKWASPP